MDYKTLKDLGAKPRKKLKFTVEVSKRCPPQYTLQIPEELTIVQLPTVTKKLFVATSKRIMIPLDSSLALIRLTDS